MIAFIQWLNAVAYAQKVSSSSLLQYSIEFVSISYLIQTLSTDKKFELMLTRHTKAYSSYCHKLSVYLQAFHLSLFLECVLQLKIVKINKTPYFGSSRSFKVIDVDTTKKLVTSACCDRHLAHGDLQPFSRMTDQQWYNDFYGGTAL